MYRDGSFGGGTGKIRQGEMNGGNYAELPPLQTLVTSTPIRVLPFSYTPARQQTQHAIYSPDGGGEG